VKLNGWRRIGIVASVVWMVGAYFSTLDRKSAIDTEMAVLVDEACIAARPQNQPVCDDRMRADITRAIPTERQDAAFVALVPIPTAWGFVYVFIFLVRWVRRSFLTKQRP
jgi:hypothetical protein